MPRGEQHSIGVAETAIQDVSDTRQCLLADSNFQLTLWDVVGYFATVFDMITSPHLCSHHE